MKPLRWVTFAVLGLAVFTMRNARAVLLAAGVALALWLAFQLYVVVPLLL